MKRLVGVCALGIGLAVGQSAYGQSITTTSGDTGMWLVPTAEVLPANKWSVSFSRTNRDDGQGFTDISRFPLSFGFGLANRAEVFLSWSLVTRLDRDTRPLFFDSTSQESSTGTGGGIVVGYPFDRQPWTGNQRGDLLVGGKVSLLSQADEAPVALAVRAMAKLPTGNKANGASSGETDFEVDGIVSMQNTVMEVSGYAGLLTRGNPDGFKLTNGLRWGVGAAFPQKDPLGLRFTGELSGEKYFSSAITAPAGEFGADGSAVPLSTTIKDPIVVAASAVWRASNGFFLGGSIGWDLHMAGRQDASCAGGCPTFRDITLDNNAYELRIGFHPWRAQVGDASGTARSRSGTPARRQRQRPRRRLDRPRRRVRWTGPPGHGPRRNGRRSRHGRSWHGDGPWRRRHGRRRCGHRRRRDGCGRCGYGALQGTGGAGTGAAGAGGTGVGGAGTGAAGAGTGAGGTGPGGAGNRPANRPPTVKATCEPCTVEIGKTSIVSGDAQDSDGDPLAYRWRANAGALASPANRQSLWTAPMQVGPVPVTVTVDDGGETASDTVTIEVIRPSAREVTFEDVHFDFDRFTLLPDALAMLDEAVAALQSNSALRLEIEGHTCNIGTPEYNLALGERRAQAVRAYLAGKGVDADRLTVVSYGEERPKYDNSREDTRRMNRRAALVVRLK